MNLTLGIILAFATMFLWGFGDFFIQRTTRKFGDWETLFVITLIGTIMLAPFCWKSFLILFSGDNATGLWVVIGCSVFLFIAAMFEFQGMKLGKIAVIEPLWSLEIISASLIAFVVLKENLSLLQIILVGTLIICFILLSIRESGSIKLHHFFMEKGVLFAMIGATVMGVSDFFMGWGSRITDPLLTNFSVNILAVIISGTYLLANGKIGKLWGDFKDSPVLLIRMSLLDNFAWIAYAFAMSMAPIGIVTSLTESSIVVAVLLGLFLNKEKLQHHQKIGLVGAVLCAVVLGFFAK